MRNFLKLIVTAVIPLGAILTAPAASALISPPQGASELAHARANELAHTVSPSGISGGALFGGDQGLLHDEGKLGRKLAIVRVYDHIGNTFPLPGNNTIMAAGRTLLVSLDSNGTSYASIAAGHKDHTIIRFLKAVNHAAIQYKLSAIYISFEHEPDNPKHRWLGTPGKFIQAWDHVRQLAKSAKLDWNNGGRLHWTWIMIHSSFERNYTYAKRFWPGASQVDIIAADGYNSAHCSSGHGTVTAASLFDPLLDFAALHGGPPVFISEWGSTNTPAGTQPAFIPGMHAYVATNPEIAAALYWDNGSKSCNYNIDSHPASISALAIMGRSAAMQGHLK